jgi:subtilisin family serine protease
MNKWIIALVLMVSMLLLPSVASAKVKVAIIDTGKPALPFSSCGEQDFTGYGINDVHGHGTNVAGIVSTNLDANKHCLLILKFFHSIGTPIDTTYMLIQALQAAIEANVDIINISASGEKRSNTEEIFVGRALDKGIAVVVAAGNDSRDLDKKCNIFPACYDRRIIVVGGTNKTSNYGKVVDVIENGINVTGFGVTLTGSSQATALHTNKLVKKMLNEKR